jgi:hypothetical protein
MPTCPASRRCGGVEELLLAMQAKLSQWLGSHATPKTVELLPVNPKGVSEIATPAQYLLEDIMQIAQFGVVAHRIQAGDHRAYIAQNSSQNQSFERNRSRHPSGLRYSPNPDVLTPSKMLEPSTFPRGSSVVRLFSDDCGTLRYCQSVAICCTLTIAKGCQPSG